MDPITHPSSSQNRKRVEIKSNRSKSRQSKSPNDQIDRFRRRFETQDPVEEYQPQAYTSDHQYQEVLRQGHQYQYRQPQAYDFAYEGSKPDQRQYRVEKLQNGYQGLQNQKVQEIYQGNVEKQTLHEEPKIQIRERVVEYIIERPVPNYIPIKVKKRRNVVGHNYPVHNQVLKEGQTVHYHNEVPRAQTLQVNVPVPETRTVHVTHKMPKPVESVSYVPQKIERPVQVTYEEVVDKIVQYPDEIVEVNTIEKIITKPNVLQNITKGYKEIEKEHRTETHVIVNEEVPKPVAGDIIWHPVPKIVEQEVHGQVHVVDFTTQYPAVNTEIIEVAQNTEVPDQSHQVYQHDVRVEYPEKVTKHAKQEIIKVDTIVQEVDQIVEKPRANHIQVDVPCTIEEAHLVDVIKDVTKIVQTPVYKDKTIQVEKIIEHIRQEVVNMKDDVKCMTGNEFVKTWNSLFRLKEDAHRPDKCLGQADFVEIIQENINANAPQFLPQKH